MSEDQHEISNSRNKAFTFWDCLCYLLLSLWFIVHNILDFIIDKIFSFFYDDTKQGKIPTVTHSFLMESASSLAERIRNKEISAVEVVEGFVERIKLVNPLINAVVCDRFELALKEAMEADELIGSGKLTKEQLQQQKPFLGIPFTTKDSTAAKGLLHTLGLVSRRNTKATEDADAVVLMKEAGLYFWASIIAANGSPLGLASDIGGSIRMPAFYCGIFGHKPTSGLTPMKGFTRRTGKEEQTMVTAGPMCRYAQDLAPFLKVIIGNNISKLKLDEQVTLEDVSFYYMESSGDPRASSINQAMQQALFKAVSHFRELSGHPIQKVTFPEMKYSFRLWRYWMTKEPMVFPEELANREGCVSPFQELPKLLVGQSDFTLASLLRLFNDMLPSEKAPWAEKTTKTLLAKIVAKLGDNGVLLYPSHPTSASYHYSSFLRPYNFGYWAVFNVLHLPVTQVPMGLDRDGLPVGIQVVAGPYQDHLCLAVAKQLQKTFGGWVPPFPV